MEEIDPDTLEQTLQTLCCQRDYENNYQTQNHSQQLADWATKYRTTFHENHHQPFSFKS